MKGVAVACFVLVVLAAVEVRETASVNCNPMDLSPCMPAMMGSGTPTKECCGKLNEQESCLCGYMRNIILRPYVDSPNAKKVAAACGVPTPQCSN